MILSFFSYVDVLNQSGINLNTTWKNDLDKIGSRTFPWERVSTLKIINKSKELFFLENVRTQVILFPCSTVPAFPNLKFGNSLECFWTQFLILRNIYKMCPIRLLKQQGNYAKSKKIYQDLQCLIQTMEMLSTIKL